MYEGEWDRKDGKKNGKGIYYINKRIEYDGEWKDDNKHGKGVFFRQICRQHLNLKLQILSIYL